MEKIGLFDLIDKFAASGSSGKTFQAAPQEEKKPEQKSDGYGLKNPDFGVQPQYMMNAKMQAFMKRHETLKLQALKNGKNDKNDNSTKK